MSRKTLDNTERVTRTEEEFQLAVELARSVNEFIGLNCGRNMRVAHQVAILFHTGSKQAFDDIMAIKKLREDKPNCPVLNLIPDESDSKD